MREKKRRFNSRLFIFFCLIGCIFCSKPVHALERITIDTTTFPDEGFRNYVSDTLDVNQDGSLSVGEQQIVTKIEISGYKCANLKGIEYFSNITSLIYNSSLLTELDVSNNTELTYISCQYASLTSLDLSKNTKLKELECNYADLTSLDLQYNIELENLHCSYSALKSINLKNNTELRILYLTDMLTLTELDLSNNKKLERLGLRGSSIAGKLDLSDCTALERVDAAETMLEEIDVSGCTNLISLMAHDSKLIRIDLSGAVALDFLTLGGTNIETLNLQDNIKLGYVSLDEMPLHHLDLSNNIEVYSLYLDGTPIESLQLNKHPNLKTLEVGTETSIIKNLDLSGETTNLKYVTIYGAESVDFGGNNTMERLDLINCQIENIDVSKFTELQRLVVKNVPIKQLDVKDNKSLKILSVIGTQMENLDVSTLIGLTQLVINNVAIKQLYLKENVSLTNLTVTGTQIEMLDLSYNTKLKVIDCSFNPLVKVTLGSNSNLTEADFHSCNLSALDASGTPNLKTLDMRFNYVYPKVSYTKKLYFSDIPGFDLTRISNLSGGTLGDNYILWTSGYNMQYYYDVGNSNIEPKQIVFYPEVDLEMEDGPSKGNDNEDETEESTTEEKVTEEEPSTEEELTTEEIVTSEELTTEEETTEKEQTEEELTTEEKVTEEEKTTEEGTAEETIEKVSGMTVCTDWSKEEGTNKMIHTLEKEVTTICSLLDTTHLYLCYHQYTMEGELIEYPLRAENLVITRAGEDASAWVETGNAPGSKKGVNFQFKEPGDYTISSSIEGQEDSFVTIHVYETTSGFYMEPYCSNQNRNNFYPYDDKNVIYFIIPENTKLNDNEEFNGGYPVKVYACKDSMHAYVKREEISQYFTYELLEGTSNVYKITINMEILEEEVEYYKIEFFYESMDGTFEGLKSDSLNIGYTHSDRIGLLISQGRLQSSFDGSSVHNPWKRVKVYIGAGNPISTYHLSYYDYNEKNELVEIIPDLENIRIMKNGIDVTEQVYIQRTEDDEFEMSFEEIGQYTLIVTLEDGREDAIHVYVEKWICGFFTSPTLSENKIVSYQLTEGNNEVYFAFSDRVKINEQSDVNDGKPFAIAVDGNIISSNLQSEYFTYELMEGTDNKYRITFATDKTKEELSRFTLYVYYEYMEDAESIKDYIYVINNISAEISTEGTTTEGTTTEEKLTEEPTEEEKLTEEEATEEEPTTEKEMTEEEKTTEEEVTEEEPATEEEATEHESTTEEEVTEEEVATEEKLTEEEKATEEEPATEKELTEEEKTTEEEATEEEPATGEEATEEEPATGEEATEEEKTPEEETPTEERTSEEEPTTEESITEKVNEMIICSYWTVKESTNEIIHTSEKEMKAVCLSLDLTHLYLCYHQYTEEGHLIEYPLKAEDLVIIRDGEDASAFVDVEDYPNSPWGLNFSFKEPGDYIISSSVDGQEESSVTIHVSEKVITEETTTEESTVEKSTAEEKPTEESTVEKSTTEELPTEEPTTEKSTTEEESTEEPTTEKSTTEEESTEEATTEKSTTEEKSTEEATTEKSTTEELPTEEPTTEKETTEEQPKEEPTTEKETTEEQPKEEPTEEKPTTEELPTEELTTEKSTTEDVRTEELTTEEVTRPGYIVDEEITTEESMKDNTSTPSSKVSLHSVTVKSIDTQTYCAKELTSELHITYQGVRLIAGQDYTVEYTNNVSAGTAEVVITGIGNYTGSRKEQFVIQPYHVQGLSEELKGKDGEIYSAGYTKKKIKLNTAFKLSYTLNGEQFYLQPKEGVDYTSQHYNNKNIGTARIVYTFKGNYTGTVVKKFLIVPPAPKLTKITKNGNAIVLKWKRVSSCDRYEIYRAASSKGKYKKIATVKGNKKLSYQDKKAKKGKKYFYKIRACKKVNGTLYNSSWSNVKKGKR